MKSVTDSNVLLLLQGKKPNSLKPVSPPKKESLSLILPLELVWKGTQKSMFMDAGDTWEHIRYQIEKKENFTDCYVEGYWFDRPTVMIRTNEHLMGGEKILLKRKPCLPGMKLYIPKKFRQEKQNEVIVYTQEIHEEDFQKMTEEEKMMAICDQVAICTLEKKDERKKKPTFWENEDGTMSSTYNVYERAGAHPSDYINKTIQHGPVPHNYRCRRCFEVGVHWEDCCPTWDDPSFVYRKQTF